MLDSVWRVYGEEFDVDSFLKNFPISTTDNIYRKGEMSLRKTPHQYSGFTVLISEKIASSENILEIESFIKNNDPALSYLKSLGVGNSIDIGCTVGTSEQFTKSVIVSPVLLSLLSQYGIALEFSAYPASDEANEI